MKPWLLLDVYASTDYRLLQVLWEETSRLVDLDLSSLVVEHFNYIESLMSRGREGHSRTVLVRGSLGSLLVRMVWWTLVFRVPMLLV